MLLISNSLTMINVKQIKPKKIELNKEQLKELAKKLEKTVKLAKNSKKFPYFK